MELTGSDKQENVIDAFSVVAHMNTTLMGQDEDEKTAALDLLPHEVSERIILAGPPLRPKSQWVESGSSEHGAYTTSEDVSTDYSFERSSESTIKTSPGGSRDNTRRNSANTGLLEVVAGEEEGATGGGSGNGHLNINVLQHGGRLDTMRPPPSAVATAECVRKVSDNRASRSLGDISRTPETIEGGRHAQIQSPLARSEHGTQSNNRRRGGRSSRKGRSKREGLHVDDSTPLVGEIEL